MKHGRPLPNAQKFARNAAPLVRWGVFGATPIADAPPYTLRPFNGPVDTIRTMIAMCKGPRGEQSVLVHSLKNHIVRELQPKDYLSELLAVRNYAAEHIRYSNDALTVEQVQDPQRISEQIIQFGKAVGDCFPAHTLVLREPNDLTEVAKLVTGDRIWGLDNWTRVAAVWDKGHLMVSAIELDNGAHFGLTPDHHVYVLDESGTEQRILVRELEVGMRVPRPESIAGGALPPMRRRLQAELRVRSVHHDVLELPCWDIQTEDHRVYLPEHDVTVSQCDDLALWIATICRQLGREAQFVTVGFGAPGKYSHVFARAKEPKSGQWIVLDPVAGSDEATMLRRVSTYRIWEI